jgi:peptidoglycan/LPS O-acetylase OafA/YrhL
LSNQLSASPGARGSPRTFVVLDGLRGIAALAVLTRHAPAYFQSISSTSSGPFWESYLAVDFFFVLSGFILAHAYGSKLVAGMTARRFLAIRFIRLYPLYFLALAMALPISFSSAMKADVSNEYLLVVDVFFGFLFLPSPASHGLFPLNGPAWSLFFEMIANFLFAILSRRLTNYLLVAIVFLAGATLIAAVSFRALGFGSAVLVDGLPRGPLDYGMEWNSFGAGLARVVYSFFAGVLVYRVWKKTPPMRVRSFVVCSLLVALLVSNPSREWKPYYDLFATLVAFPLLVFFGASCAVSGFSAHVFSALGQASYAIYVLQSPFQWWSFVVTKRAPINVNEYITPCLFTLSMFLFALIADRFFDSPVRNFFMAMLSARGSRPNVELQTAAIGDGAGTRIS